MCRHLVEQRTERASQSSRPRQNRRVRSPQGRSSIISILDRLGLFDGLPLHLNVDRGVTVGRGDASVAQPLADREDVDARSQQMYRGAVAHAVGVQTLACKRGSRNLSTRAMFPQDIPNTEPGEDGTIAVTEQWITDKGLASAFCLRPFSKQTNLLRLGN